MGWKAGLFSGCHPIGGRWGDAKLHQGKKWVVIVGWQRRPDENQAAFRFMISTGGNLARQGSLGSHSHNSPGRHFDGTADFLTRFFAEIAEPEMTGARFVPGEFDAFGLARGTK